MAVKALRSTTGVLLAIAGIGAHLPIARIVSARCSGKRLQVSDHCGAQVRIERKRSTFVTDKRGVVLSQERNGRIDLRLLPCP